jgi:hypothetical protein
MTKSGNVLEVSADDIKNLPTDENLLLVGSGINTIIDDIKLRFELHKKFSVNDVVYFLCADSIDKETKTLYIETENISTVVEDIDKAAVIDVTEKYEPILYTRR